MRISYVQYTAEPDLAEMNVFIHSSIGGSGASQIYLATRVCLVLVNAGTIAISRASIDSPKM